MHSLPLRHILKVWRIIGVSLFALFLNACMTGPMPIKPGPTAMAGPATSEIVLTPTPEPQLQPITTSIPTPLSVVKPISATLSPAALHQLVLKGQRANWVTLDQNYLYWTVYQVSRHIFRYPLAGGEIEIVATSRFEDGNLTTFHPILSGDWMIFLDTPSSSGNTVWVVRALNLSNRTEQVVIEEAGDPASWPGPWLSADGDWVVWTRTVRAKDGACIESILAARNLRSGQQRGLERACAEDNLMWVIPHLSGNRLVVERDLPDSKGGGNDVYLFDLVSGQRAPLTNDGRSSMPVVSDPWIVWKAGPRFKPGQYNIVYNRLSGNRQIVPILEESGDPRLAADWLYWQPAAKQPFYVYNVKTEQMLTVVMPGENESIAAVSVYDNTIAWLRDLDFSHAMPHDTVLEWRTLP